MPTPIPNSRRGRLSRSTTLRLPRRSLLLLTMVVAAVTVSLFADGDRPSAAIAADEAAVEANHTDHDHTSAAADDTEHSHGEEGAAGAHAGEHADEHEEGHSGGHSNPVAPLLAAIVLILLCAKVGGDIFERLHMPAVLGELTVGILIGNLGYLTGFDLLEFLHAPAEGSLGNPYSTGAALKMLAEIGVVLLLFEVGLESSIKDMLRVGASSLLVALLGVVAPMLLGIGVGALMLSHEPWQVHLFLGATLCATSVGITARVLKDLGRSQQRESQIILGAAVIDDVLGLIVLAVVSGIIEKGADFEAASLITIIAKALGFLLVAVLLGSHLLTRPVFKAASFLRGHGLLVASSLVICFGLAFLANLVGLAPIVGAFAAGLILEKAHYRELGGDHDVELEEALAPLTALLVPIFFVDMGIEVSLESFATPSVWGLAAALTVVAIIGKQVCSFGVLEKGLNKTAVGVGMIPRGEVGLIFAGVGLALRSEGEPVISASTYSAIVVMVMLTTMVTPPALKWVLNREGEPQTGTGAGFDTGESAAPEASHHVA